MWRRYAATCKRPGGISGPSTSEAPTKPIIDDAKQAGHYRHEDMGRDYPKVDIVTVQEILEEKKRLQIPMSLDVLKSAQRESEDQFTLL